MDVLPLMPGVGLAVPNVLQVWTPSPSISAVQAEPKLANLRKSHCKWCTFLHDADLDRKNHKPSIPKKESHMATYECPKCGMGVNATCAKCDAPLVDDMLKLDDGSEVRISKCPNGHGKIKSPQCCGQDMTCAVS